jgi:hypothetical protein
MNNYELITNCSCTYLSHYLYDKAAMQVLTVTGGESNLFYFTVISILLYLLEKLRVWLLLLKKIRYFYA